MYYLVNTTLCFDRFCTILTDASLIINTFDYFVLFFYLFWLFEIDQNHSSGEGGVIFYLSISYMIYLLIIQLFLIDNLID